MMVVVRGREWVGGAMMHGVCVGGRESGRACRDGRLLGFARAALASCMFVSSLCVCRTCGCGGICEVGMYGGGGP